MVVGVHQTRHHDLVAGVNYLHVRAVRIAGLDLVRLTHIDYERALNVKCPILDNPFVRIWTGD